MVLFPWGRKQGVCSGFCRLVCIMRYWSLTGTFVWFSVSKAILFYTFLDKARHVGNIKVLAVFVARKKRNDHI